MGRTANTFFKKLADKPKMRSTDESDFSIYSFRTYFSNNTEGEEPPTPTFKVGICLKTLQPLGQEDLNNIRLILLTATLEKPALADLEVTNNITDIRLVDRSLRSIQQYTCSNL